MAEIVLNEDAELLFQILSLIAPLGLSLRHDIGQILRTDAFSKKHLLLKVGQVARRIYFIKQGFARAFYLDPNGKEHTLWFMGVGEIMISVYSFFMQQPAFETIELMEDCVLQSVTYEQLLDIYADHPVFNYHGRKLTEAYYIKAEERLIMLHCKKPVDRLKLLLKTHPNIFQKASRSEVASYLGIEPETLSRLRKYIR